MNAHSDSTKHAAQLEQWIDAHFDEQLAFLQQLVRLPTDTPPGNNTPHALLTAQLLEQMGITVQRHEVPSNLVKAAGLESITNLIARRDYGQGGKTIALNAHGDVVPPGEGWTHGPYSATIDNGFLYGRAAAVSKCDFATFTFAVRAIEAVCKPTRGAIELHFTYDEEFGGELGPGWLLAQGLTKPDMMVAAGFSYQVVVAHNGCLQMQVTVNGQMSHAAIPDSGTDALQGAVHIMNTLYELNREYLKVSSKVAGITHPYLNIGVISGGTNTNVVPGAVSFKLDRRMIPEEDPSQVEAHLRATIAAAAASFSPPRGSNQISVTVERILLAHALTPLPTNQTLVNAFTEQASAVMGEPVHAIGTPLYTDVRLYCQQGIPGIIYGAGPRTVLESNAKRADERISLDDLRKATKVVARSLAVLLK